MANYNSQLQSNNMDLQTVLQTLQTKAVGGEQATPVISVNTSGLITATAGTKYSTYQLAFQPAKTITPSTTSQVAVSSGYYTGGNITVAAVPTQSKSVTPTSSTQNVTPDSGKFLSKVTVNAIPSTYVKPSYTKAATTYTPTTTNQTISARTYLTGAQTIKGDSNLVAENIKSGVSIFGVNGTLVEGSGGSSGSGEQEDAFITRAISGSYFNDRVTTIGGGAFAGCLNLTTVSFPVCTTIDCASATGNFPKVGAFQYCRNLKKVSFPVCTTIGSNAFYNCDESLTTASFPACTTIGSSAFANCDSLTTVSFPVCKIIGGSAFYHCKGLATVSFPVCTTIGSSVFDGCESLTTAIFPSCTTIATHAFDGCNSLTTASFPACTTIYSYAFYSCESLTTANFPVCTKIYYSAFAWCNNLTTASFPVCTTIGSYTFAYCYNLKSLYLTGPSLCTLSNSNAFTSTPIGGYSTSAGTYGSIYIPASLLTSYQTATNWTYFSSRFVAFDGDIITFTISGRGYQAEDGMTWAEWVESEYNPNIYYIYNGMIMDQNRYCVMDASPDSIITVKNYEIEYAGGEGN